MRGCLPHCLRGVCPLALILRFVTTTFTFAAHGRRLLSAPPFHFVLTLTREICHTNSVVWRGLPPRTASLALSF